MIRIRQIEINVLNNQEVCLIKKCCNILKIKKKDIINLKINKKSIDARHKPNIFYVYEVDIEVEGENKILKYNKNINVIKTPDEKYRFNILGNKTLDYRPVIVGSGPAGLFCSYILAENGYKPLIIERGEKIEDRICTVERFWKEGILNKNSNVQFGEGGAGTFSDGKLNTLVKDKLNRQKKVLEIFVECGAPKEILYLNKPHIGTDILRKVIINMRNKLISMGVEFKYNSTVTDFIIENNSLKEIEINGTEKIKTNVLVLAIGHSARDTFEVLYKKNVNMQSKPFAVGIRIQHPQDMIGYAQYNDLYKILEPASYKLTYKAKNNRGVYTFCMCPGGYIVNSSSEYSYLAINGMSNYKRNTKNANSAIIVTVDSNDFGKLPLDGLKFQRKLEEKAYKIGLGKIPIQKYIDYKNNKKTTVLGNIDNIAKGKCNFSNVRAIFKEEINNSIIEAIEYFDTKIPGFARDDSIIAAVESRTSSPIKIIRDINGESNIKGIYPCGEGAGYAGGITSAAVDGILQAENIAKIYKS